MELNIFLFVSTFIQVVILAGFFPDLRHAECGVATWWQSLDLAKKGQWPFDDFPTVYVDGVCRRCM
jgi:hypothetical protein